MGLLTDLREQVSQWRQPKTLGQRGEAAAAKFLKRLGYLIIAQGERDGLGELDLIAVDSRTVVFIEVKTRKSLDKGHPADAVDDGKQRRITRLALAYLKRHHLLEYKARFDIVAVVWPDDVAKPTIEHFKNAFEPTGQWQMFS